MQDEDTIRSKAYRIWEESGKPEGRHDEHWQQACEELAPLAPEPLAAQKMAPPTKTGAAASPA